MPVKRLAVIQDQVHLDTVQVIQVHAAAAGRERLRTPVGPVGPAGPPGRPAARPGGYDRFRYQGRTTVSKRWRAEPMAMCMSRYW